MWLLKKLSDETVKYLISDNKTYTVGRKNCDIILDEDASISRKHCTIYIAKQNECPFPVNTLTGVWIVDEQSKYGTYLKSNNDWIKLNPNQNKKLSSGSIIKFGLIENIWSLEFKPLIVSTSGIQTEQKKEIERKVESVNGFLKSNWCKDCSALVVNEITLTIKVVLALINGVPIVTPNYLDKVVESVKNQIPFPNYENYRPAIKESILDVSLVSLDIKKNRKELFKGLIFVIPTKKQLETLKEVIICAGGKIELFSSAGNWERFAEENIVLIQLPLNGNTVSEEVNKCYKEITLFLKNNYGRRVVPESEIAQAVAYSSVEKYCNPKSTCFNLSRAQRQFEPGESLVHETPEIEKVEIPEPFVIPSSATIESQLNQVSSSEISKSFQKERKKSFEDRKRSHSPRQLDAETKPKKARNKKNESFVQKPKESVEKIVSIGSDLKVKKSFPKTSCITSFFQKQKKCENVLSEVAKESDGKFWEENEKSCESSESNKRKFPSDDDGEEGEGSSSSRKRAKVPEGKQLVAIETPREVVEVAEESSNFRNIALSFGRNNIEEESNFEDFIEKEKTDALNKSVDDLNTTIFSLTLISSAYLKEDGSLIEPPNVPVNVKRFRKQKIKSNIIVVPIGENNGESSDGESSDGEWIEPHSGKNNISSLEEGEIW